MIGKAVVHWWLAINFREGFLKISNRQNVWFELWRVFLLNFFNLYFSHILINRSVNSYPVSCFLTLELLSSAAAVNFLRTVIRKWTGKILLIERLQPSILLCVFNCVEDILIALVIHPFIEWNFLSMKKLLNLFELLKSCIFLKCVFQLPIHITNLDELVEKLQWIFSNLSYFTLRCLNLRLLRQDNRLYRKGLV
jgi:hypothetical protein